MTEPPELWSSPFGEAFLDRVRGITTELFIISPYVRLDGVSRVLETLKTNPFLDKVSVRVLTRFDEDAFAGGHSHPQALLALLDLGEFCRVEMRWLPNLHAKVYVFDREAALVTSANLTADSFFQGRGGGNTEERAGDLEYGVLLKSPPAVEKLLSDMERFWQAAAPVTEEELNRVRGAG